MKSMKKPMKSMNPVALVLGIMMILMLMFVVMAQSNAADFATPWPPMHGHAFHDVHVAALDVHSHVGHSHTIVSGHHA